MLPIETTFNFNQLSLKDLIEARDTFHLHLMNKKNVIATAIGKYRIRKNDPFPGVVPITKTIASSKNVKEARTLSNSEIREYSWPCILVFISQWLPAIDLISEDNTDILPKRIYMPDGRIVPICVVEAEKSIITDDNVDESNVIFPTNVISGGFPLIIESQGVERIASVGCLVTDGSKYYALTNKHVAGDAGTEVYTKMHGDLKRIGISTDKQINKVGFTDLYPEWNCKKVFVNNDIALIEIDDVNQWKTEILGIGQVDEMADLDTSNLSLNLISTNIYENGKLSFTTSKVSACGAVSGILTGEIAALFYRYKSKGGIEYVADFLIGGASGASLNTHRGDSGTLWLLDTIDRDGKVYKQPFAVQWGQHDFFEGDSKFKNSFALATCLSNACRILDVDIVRGWNLDIDNSWGKTGHYSIGNLSIAFIADNELKDLMKENVKNISFDISDINPDWDSSNKEIKAQWAEKFKTYCPLADVPDIIWKQSSKTTTWGRQGPENVNHYLDADLPLLDGKTDFFEVVKSKDDLTIKNIEYYYANIDKKKVGLKTDPNKGILPLRIWQIFDYMIHALQNKDAHRFILAAGVMTHYTGDACQPLHSSYMADGDPAEETTITVTAKRDSFHKDGSISHKKGDVYQKQFNPGSGVHVAYEDHMIDTYKKEIIKGIQKFISHGKNNLLKDLPAITSGQSAGFAVVELMKQTHKTIAPKDIIKSYEKNKNSGNLDKALWAEFSDRTIECMARGCCFQSAIWEAAWKISGAKASWFKDVKFESADFRNAIKKLYHTPSEIHSCYIDEISKELSTKEKKHKKRSHTSSKK